MKIKLLLLFLLLAGILKAQIIPFYSSTDSKYGFIDEKGKVIIEPKYELAYTLNEGMAAVRLDRKYGYVNSEGQEVIAPKYDHTWKFIDGYAAVQLGDKYGFIDSTGKEVIPLIYENAYNHHGTCCYKGQAHVKLDGKWKIIPMR